MRWRRSAGRDERGQIEDRRAHRRGGALGGARGGIGGLGIVGVIVALVFILLGRGGGGGFGLDMGPLDALPAGPSPQGGIPADLTAEDDLRAFVTFVVNDVQNSWTEAFQRAGLTYPVTRLVLFRGAVRTACGDATSATGPFNCPADRRVYLDLDFFRELSRRYGAPGDFAQAYVIAHEFGHHVQNVTGIMGQVTAAQRDDPARANELSVRLELQADCLAGVWAHSAYRDNLLEPGDLEEGLAAAAAVGDDRLQAGAGLPVDPESFTHGTSRQRVDWFTRGFADGDAAACDTFAADI